MATEAKKPISLLMLIYSADIVATRNALHGRNRQWKRQPDHASPSYLQGTAEAQNKYIPDRAPSPCRHQAAAQETVRYAQRELVAASRGTGLDSAKIVPSQSRSPVSHERAAELRTFMTQEKYGLVTENG